MIRMGTATLTRDRGLGHMAITAPLRLFIWTSENSVLQTTFRATLWPTLDMRHASWAMLIPAHAGRPTDILLPRNLIARVLGVTPPARISLSPPADACTACLSRFARVSLTSQQGANRS